MKRPHVRIIQWINDRGAGITPEVVAAAIGSLVEVLARLEQHVVAEAAEQIRIDPEGVVGARELIGRKAAVADEHCIATVHRHARVGIIFYASGILDATALNHLTTTRDFPPLDGTARGRRIGGEDGLHAPDGSPPDRVGSENHILDATVTRIDLVGRAGLRQEEIDGGVTGPSGRA